MTCFDTILAQSTAADTTPFLAQTDEDAYVEAILPILPSVEQPSWPGPDFCECGTQRGEYGECLDLDCEA